MLWPGVVVLDVIVYDTEYWLISVSRADVVYRAVWLTHCGCTWKHRSQLSQRCITNVGHVNMTITHWRPGCWRDTRPGRGGRSRDPAGILEPGLEPWSATGSRPATSHLTLADITKTDCHSPTHYSQWSPELDSISIMYVNLPRQCYYQMASN